MFVDPFVKVIEQDLCPEHVINEGDAVPKKSQVPEICTAAYYKCTLCMVVTQKTQDLASPFCEFLLLH